MKTTITLLIIGIIVSLYIIWAQSVEFKHLNNNVQILRDNNTILERNNKLLSKKYDSLISKIPQLDSIEQSLNKENKYLRIQVKYKEEELKSIKGRYNNLSNDSLLKSLITAYEIDSINSIIKH